MRTMLVPFILISTMFAANAEAQDRGVSIPGVYTPDEADDFVAREVTTALRTAGSMMPAWRLSTDDLPLEQLMRACNGTRETGIEGCMAQAIVTRDPSMTGGLVIFALMQRVGEGNGFRVTLALYDMSIGERAHRIEAPVARIMAPTARNREAAEWLRQLTTPPAEPESGEPVAVRETSDPPSTETGETTDPPPPEVTPPRATREPTDFTFTDVTGLSLVGLGGAAAVVALVSGGVLLGLGGDAEYNAYRASWDTETVPDVCRMAENDTTPEGRHAAGICRDAGMLEIVTHVMWAIAGASAVAGAFTFLLPHAFDAPAGSAELTLRPRLAPTQAGLDVRLAF